MRRRRMTMTGSSTSMMLLRLLWSLILSLSFVCHSFQQPRFSRRNCLRHSDSAFLLRMQDSSEAVKVVCIGELLIDFVAEESNVNLPDVSSFTCAPGGAPANVAVGVQRLGSFQSAFVGKVGNDPFGVKLRTTLNQAHVDTSGLLVDDDEQTTIVFVSVWDDGRKDMCFYRGADRSLLETEISMDMFESAQCVHCGSITLIDEPGASAQRRLLQQAKEKNLMVTYDPNYRPTLWPDEATARRTIFDGFRYASLAKISEEEFSFVTGHDDIEKGIQAVLDQGVELVVLSRGEGGALACTGDFLIESPALKDIQVVETTGAGDSFMAAMISRLLPEFQRLGGSFKSIEKQVVQDALDYANVVAGLTCTKPGAIPALPTKEMVESFIQRVQTRTPTTDAPEAMLNPKTLAKMIDHTYLKPHGEPKDIEQLCQEAAHYGFAMVAVNPAQVQRCAEILAGTDVRVGAAIGFPLGQSTSNVKIYEVKDAIQHGATEVDMVLNVFELQNGNHDYIRSEIEQLVQACKGEDGTGGVICKVILETCYLTDEQKIQACNICRDAGVDFVKTSTGFGSAGATAADVQLMRETMGSKLGVKASGGIRSLADVKNMIAAGANRIGTSNGVAIMKELESC